MRGICSILLVFCVRAQIAPEQRSKNWHDDLEFLSRGLKAPGVRIAAGIATRGQKDFAILYPHFDTEIESLENDIPQLADSEVCLRLMRLMASAHVAHNEVQVPASMGFVSRLALTLRWFADGLAVEAASPDYATALGARVISIGGTAPETFLNDLAAYVSYENEAELRASDPVLMTSWAVLSYRRCPGAGAEQPDGEGCVRRPRPEEFSRAPVRGCNRSLQSGRWLPDDL
jgi:hypothetical protein